jgi:hypothetical protein
MQHVGEATRELAEGVHRPAIKASQMLTVRGGRTFASRPEPVTWCANHNFRTKNKRLVNNPFTGA